MILCRLIGMNHLYDSQPTSHNSFIGVSGKIEGTITAKTPVFIFDSPRKTSGPESFITNQQGQHIIPGSSLKGLFRSLVETVGNGCLMFHEVTYEYKHQRKTITVNYQKELPRAFKKCDSSDLCIACRMFGRIPGRK